jgi:hypothetical protein
LKVGFRTDNDIDRDDEAVLLIALRDERVLVTHDISTIPPLFFRLREGRELPGVLLIPQNYPIGMAVERLHLIWILTEAREWRNRICYLPTLADFVP